MGGFDGGHVATWTGADYGDIDVVVGGSSGGGGEASRGDSGEHVLSWRYDFSEKLDFYEKMKKIKNKNKLQSCVYSKIKRFPHSVVKFEILNFLDIEIVK